MIEWLKQFSPHFHQQIAAYAYAISPVLAYIVCIFVGGVNDMSAAFGFGRFTSTAVILVLFILLVIVSRSFGFGI